MRILDKKIAKLGWDCHWDVVSHSYMRLLYERKSSDSYYVYQIRLCYNVVEGACYTNISCAAKNEIGEYEPVVASLSLNELKWFYRRLKAFECAGKRGILSHIKPLKD